jgi:hypothetical protein
MDVRNKAAEESLARFPKGVVTDNWRFRVDEPQGEARSFVDRAFAQFVAAFG